MSKIECMRAATALAERAASAKTALSSAVIASPKGAATAPTWPPACQADEIPTAKVDEAIVQTLYLIRPTEAIVRDEFKTCYKVR
jgi:hypothetical protein